MQLQAHNKTAKIVLTHIKCSVSGGLHRYFENGEVMKFDDLGINSKIVEQTKKSGFSKLTYIQERCINEILKGKDIIGQAETGSGKTLAFVLPILDRIRLNRGLQVLVLTPTRELCVQVTEVFQEFGKNLGVKTVSVYGGVSIKSQIRKLYNVHIVVGTPGRVLDHINRKTIDFGDIKFLVIDETDKMLDMGFIKDVEEIICHTSNKRQSLLFSATVSQDIQRIARKFLRNPLIIKTRPLVEEDKLKQIYYDIYKHNDRFSLLVHLLKNNESGLSIVFCGTRRETDVVAKNLRRQSINALAIHGGMTQDRRLRSLNALRKQETDVLVATDVAARGLDIKNVTHVYNYDVPKTSKDYIHRIGRTARAGKDGIAITLLTKKDHDNFRRVQSNEKLKIEPAEFPQFKKVPFFNPLNRKNDSYDRKYKKFR